VLRARRAGVGQMVAIGIELDSSVVSAQLASKHDIYFSAGVHPNSAQEWDSATAEKIAALLEDDRAVAVGETGLDFYRDSCPPEVQRAAFRDHIELARSHDKALVVHTRASTSDALDELEAAGGWERVVLHCWSGSLADLQRALTMGIYVSFAGNVSFKSAGELRELANQVPMERLLVETDSPYLAPVPHRGEANEPAFVADVGTALATALDIPVEDLARATTQNARMLFNRQ
jgi:TatD DNase family protein